MTKLIKKIIRKELTSKKEELKKAYLASNIDKGQQEGISDWIHGNFYRENLPNATRNTKSGIALKSTNIQQKTFEVGAFRMEDRDRMVMRLAVPL